MRATSTKFATLSSTTRTAASLGIDNWCSGWVSGEGDGLAIRPAYQEAFDLLGERVNIDRLLNVAVAACLQRPFPVAAHDIGGDGHDRESGKAGVGSDRRGQSVAVDIGHVYVKQ